MPCLQRLYADTVRITLLLGCGHTSASDELCPRARSSTLDPVCCATARRRRRGGNSYKVMNFRIKFGVHPVQRFNARRKLAGSLKFRYSATASLLNPLI